MAVLVGIAVVAMLAGAIFYNKLRASVYGIIGVGGSYFATIGIMVLVMLISSIFSGFDSLGASSAEIVVYIVFMLAGVGYLAYVMVVRCETAMQRVLLPLIAVMIAFGFCWRFIMMLIFKIPMGNGAPAAPKFPATLTDDKGELWKLKSDAGDHAEYYCLKTGDTTTIWYTGDYAAIPAGWREN